MGGELKKDKASKHESYTLERRDTITASRMKIPQRHRSQIVSFHEAGAATTCPPESELLFQPVYLP